MRIGKPKTVFARAFLVLVAAGVLVEGILLSAISGLAPKASPSVMLFANVNLYLDLLSDRIAANPRAEIAENLLRETLFDVRASGALTWHTTGTAAEPEEVEYQPGPGGKKMVIEGNRPAFTRTVPTKSGPLVLTFLGPPRPLVESPPVKLTLFGGMFLIVFVVASLAVRRILNPLTVLSRAFEEVKQGRIQTAVPVTGEDELSRLSRSFNEMAAGIRFLIKDKEQLFTELSHEFRAPIARVFAANALVDDPDLQTQIASDLKELDGLIHAQMTAARLEAGTSSARLESIDLTDLLEDVARLFPQRKGRIDLHLPTESITCEGDARSLRILFRNLVENALKYSPGESTVHLGAAEREGRARVCVSDQGSGISHGEQAQLFQPFYRGDDREKLRQAGYGLGLALCRRIVKAHGGELRVESAAGKGTTIEVTLPTTLPLSDFQTAA